MTYIFDEYGERHRFDAFCKTVLRYEAINYFRELNRQRKYSIQFSALSQSKLEKLYIVDEYPSDKFAFSAFGHVLHIQSEFIADAFVGLPKREQQILILHCVLELPDREVGNFVGLSRSAIQMAQNKDTERTTKKLEIQRREKLILNNQLLMAECFCQWR